MSGLVTLTFDDEYATFNTNGLPILASHGFQATLGICTSFVDTDGYMTTAQLVAAEAAGHEIASHSVTHTDLTTLTPAELVAELEDSKSWLDARVVTPVQNFLIPFAPYNDAVIAAIELVYRSARTCDEGYNSYHENPYRLKAKWVHHTTTTAEVEAWVAAAKANNQWLILLFHTVDATYAEGHVTVADFTTMCDSITASGLPVMTMNDALDYTEGIVSEVTGLSALTSWSSLKTISVSNLPYMTAARLYDTSNNAIGSAVESGGTATITPTDGLFGWLGVYQDDSYMVLLDRYPEGGNGAGSYAIYGGDEYYYEPRKVTYVKFME